MPSAFLEDLCRRLPCILLATAMLGALASDAQAQWSPGWFWGYDPTYTPSVDFINRQAIERIQAAASAPGPSTVSPGQPDHYTRYTRDPEFFERYDIETRQALENRVARKPSKSPVTAQPSPRPSPTPAAASIASFFDKYKRVVWPGDAPTEGDLGAKRVASDKACVAVLEETQYRGAAQLTTVTDARARLLEYGRPALQYVRTHSTPRIADGFHEFLLSLYNSLAAAAQKANAPGR